MTPGLYLALYGLFAACLLACSKPETATAYDCAVQGERFHYRAGERQGAVGPQPLQFKLLLRAKSYRIEAQPALSELADQRIVLDANRSNPAESVYLHEHTDAATGFRTVNSLVLNLVSGDVRLFHHRFIPPAHWRDSDKYIYTGVCRPPTKLA
jgi:hypothetical protein